MLAETDRPGRGNPRRTDEMLVIGRGQRLAAALQQGAVKTGEHRPRRNPGAVVSHEQVVPEVANETTSGGSPRPTAGPRRLSPSGRRPAAAPRLPEWRP